MKKATGFFSNKRLIVGKGKSIEQTPKRFFAFIPKMFEMLRNDQNSSLKNDPNKKRTYFTAFCSNITDEKQPNDEKQQILKEIQDLHDNILTSNWNDCFSLVLNVPIWEGVASSIEHKMKLMESDKEIKKAKDELDTLLDLLFILEDLRDHINELLEQSSRSTGLAGTNVCSSFEVSNVHEHIDFLKKHYEHVLKTYPQYKYQINSVLGKGLALLRQKYNFKWKHMHEFFF